MKKRSIAAVLIIVVLLMLSGLYVLGYFRFRDYIPTFTFTPITTQSNNTAESKGTPELVIENIRGRFSKISVDIKNIGDQDVRSVNWSISVTGGFLKRIDVYSSGMITSLSIQSISTVMTDRIPFGLGRLEITVMAESGGVEPVAQAAQGFRLFFFVIGV